MPDTDIKHFGTKIGNRMLTQARQITEDVTKYVVVGDAEGRNRIGPPMARTSSKPRVAANRYLDSDISVGRFLAK